MRDDPSKLALLGVGWDVGGWLGRKQAVAVIGYAVGRWRWFGAPRRFAVADLAPVGGGPLALLRLAWPDAPADTLNRQRVVIAIDAPLGFPRDFHRLLAGREAVPLPSGREIDNPLAYRATERAVFDAFGKKPLSAPFDKLGNNATVAMTHCRLWARDGRFRPVPFLEDDGAAHAIIEVYPALAKGGGAAARPRLAALLPTGVAAGTDEYDAALCAVLALAYGLGGRDSTLPPLVGPPAALDRETLATEGWIYYAPPAWLDPA